MTTVQAEAAIGAVFARHRPVAGAVKESCCLAIQLAESGLEEDQLQLADAVAFGVASLGLLVRTLQLSVLSLELAAAAEERAVLAELMAEVE